MSKEKTLSCIYIYIINLKPEVSDVITPNRLGLVACGKYANTKKYYNKKNTSVLPRDT